MATLTATGTLTTRLPFMRSSTVNFVGKLLTGTNNQITHNALLFHEQFVPIFPIESKTILVSAVVENPGDQGDVGAKPTRDFVTGTAVWRSASPNNAIVRVKTTLSSTSVLRERLNIVTTGTPTTHNAIVSGSLKVSAKTAGSVTGTATLSAASTLTVGVVSSFCRGIATHSGAVSGKLRRFRFTAMKVSQSAPRLSL